MMDRPDARPPVESVLWPRHAHRDVRAWIAISGWGGTPIELIRADRRRSAWALSRRAGSSVRRVGRSIAGSSYRARRLRPRRVARLAAAQRRRSDLGGRCCGSDVRRHRARRRRGPLPAVRPRLRDLRGRLPAPVRGWLDRHVPHPSPGVRPMTAGSSRSSCWRRSSSCRSGIGCSRWLRRDRGRLRSRCG